MGQGASSDGRALLKAVERDDTEAVRTIVSDSPRAVLHKTVWRKETPLMVASRNGNILTVSTLLWASERALGEGYLAYLNDADGKGYTALAHAAKLGHTTVLRVLLEEGAGPLPANRSGSTALHLAAARGHTQCVQLLLDAPVHPPSGRTARAAQAMVRDAAGEQQYMDAHNRHGFAALHLAVVSHSAGVASALVQRGAALDVPIMRGLDRMPFMCGGSTPLHIAAAQGDARMCALLLDGQARHPGLELRRIRNMLGLTPLNCALLGGHHEVVRVLVEPRRRAGGGGAVAALQRSSVLHSAFPDSLRRHMLALLRRAALLVQLRQISGGWGAQGVGRPSDQVLADIPGLESLSLPQIARLQRLLRRSNASLRDVLFGLESALQGGQGGESSSGSDNEHDSEEGEDEVESMERGGASGAAAGAGPPASRQGVDWTVLGTNVVLGIHPQLAPSSTLRMRDTRRARRRLRHAAEEASSGHGRVRTRHQRRLQQTLEDVVSLAEAQILPSVPASASAESGGSGAEAAKVGAVSQEQVPFGQEECSICMDSAAEVALRPCAHALCFHCACRLCARTEAATCPFCRQGIDGVAAIPGARAGPCQSAGQSTASDAPAVAAA